MFFFFSLFVKTRCDDDSLFILPCKWTRLVFWDGYFQTEIIFWNGLPKVLALTPLKICGPWKERTQFGRIHVDGFQKRLIWDEKKRGLQDMQPFTSWLLFFFFLFFPQKNHKKVICSSQKHKKHFEIILSRKNNSCKNHKISKLPQH